MNSLRLCMTGDYPAGQVPVTDQELTGAVGDWNAVRKSKQKQPVSGKLVVKREFVLGNKDADAAVPKLSVSFLPSGEVEISELEELADFFQQRFLLDKRPTIGITP